MNKVKYYLGICAVLNMTTELRLTLCFSMPSGEYGCIFFQGTFQGVQTECKILPFLYVVK